MKRLAHLVIALAIATFTLSAIGNDFISLDTSITKDEDPPKTCAGGAEQQCATESHFFEGSTVPVIEYDHHGNPYKSKSCLRIEMHQHICYGCEDKKKTARVISASNPRFRYSLSPGACGNNTATTSLHIHPNLTKPHEWQVVFELPSTLPEEGVEGIWEFPINHPADKNAFPPIHVPTLLPSSQETTYYPDHYIAVDPNCGHSLKLEPIMEEPDSGLHIELTPSP